MPNQIDLSIASYLVKYMLSYPKIDLEILKDQFKLDDLQIRKALIRLFFQGKVFGRLETVKNKSFLIFAENFNQNSLSIEEIMDWSIAEFDLKNLLESTKDLENKISEEETGDYDNQFRNNSNVLTEISRTKEISQKDLISVETRFGIAGYKLTIRLKIRNGSNDSINEGKIRINIPDKLKFIEILPSANYTLKNGQIWVDIDKIKQKEIISYTFYFSQMVSGEIIADGFFQYKSIDGFVRLIRIESIKCNTDLPSFVQATIDPETIKSFIKNPEMYKRMVAFGLPSTITAENAQKRMKIIVDSLKFKEISTITKPKNIMTFYFGQGEDSNKQIFDILVVPQIKDQIIGFYCCCKYEQIVSNLLRTLSLKLHEQLIKDSIIQARESLIDLNCIKCGTVFTKFPEKGESMTCRKCYTLQTPWH